MGTVRCWIGPRFPATSSKLLKLANATNAMVSHRFRGNHTIRPTDASNAAWFGVDDIPHLAFDHDLILHTAHERLRGKIRYQPIGFELLPQRFPLRTLQAVYEKILDRRLDKRNFRKKILGMGVLDELEEIETDVSHRAARLYRFNKRKYDRMAKRGFNFEI